MRIGIVATRLAGVDGVSLETTKWITILERLGHEVFLCAGELEPGGPPGMLVPEMHFRHPMNQSVEREAFGGMDIQPGLNAEIQRMAYGLALSLQAFIEDFRLDVLVVQQASAIPMHVPLGVAIYDVIEQTNIPTIAHHHDFYWERQRFLVNRIPIFLRKAFPPLLPSIQHVVISTVMKRELYIRYGINAMFLPNVFDFENPPAPPDEYAKGFRTDMGFAPDDVVVLQPTRLIARKAIERAIQLVDMLGNKRVFRFVITGQSSDEPGPYFEWLFDQAVKAGVDVHFIGDRIGVKRGTNAEGERVYALWDVYPQADLVTYLSAYEGFGNALVETLYFKLPLVVNRYAPYRSDIRTAGVKAIEIDEFVTPHAAVQVMDLLNDRDRIENMVEHNYQVGLEHFSYNVMERKIGQLLDRINHVE